MNGNRRMETALIAIAALALALSSWLHPSPATPWQFRLEVASIRLSITSGNAPVRNWTGLFETGQSLTGRIAF